MDDPCIWIDDNLNPLSDLIPDESVDLIYLDPPFNTGKIFQSPIGRPQLAKFNDIWTEQRPDDEYLLNMMSHAGYRVMETAGITHSKAMRNYLAFMGPRLVLMHRALKPTGSLFLHCDPTANSYLRLIMDAIFGRNNFANEIVWGYRGPGAKKKFGSKHDTLLFYRKSQDFLFNPQYTPMLEATKKLYRHDDNDGKGKYLLVKNKKTGKQYKSYLKQE